jgi:enoyl-CoA hydratase
MGWVQGAVWSNSHVREAVAAVKEKRRAEFPPLQPLESFREHR